MKILRLRFKNIHSLKGEHLIDFTVAPLRDAGLFAITGPTGAGKSTILDVITLALFNKIPRF
ncbi:MAG: AAA family ATPase, partial [Saprospiraceae bacterium]